MRDNRRSYTNGELTVYWDPELCIHVMNCIRTLPEVFNSSKRPWVNIHAAGTKDIIRGVDSCPTGALTWKLNKDLTEQMEPKSEDVIKPATEITLLKDGPVKIKGNFIVLDENGCAIKTPKYISLCRCGASKNKPYCDNSHKKIDFKSEKE